MTDHRTTFAAYFTSVGTFLLGWAGDNPAQFVGVVCAIGTFAVNWWAQYRKLKLIEQRVNTPFPSISELDQ